MNRNYNYKREVKEKISFKIKNQHISDSTSEVK